jgi:flagellar biosynthesis protein FlhB
MSDVLLPQVAASPRHDPPDGRAGRVFPLCEADPHSAVLDDGPMERSVFAHMHLQWFAAEDEGRTEEPTEYKIRKAREEGKVAKSQEVSGALVLLFPVVALAIISPYLLATTVEMVSFFFSMATEIDVTRDFQIMPAFYSYFIRLTWPIATVAVISAILGNLVQVGFLFSTKPITPDLQKIVPRLGKFLQRSFFSAEAGFNLAKSVFKIIVIALIGFLNVRAEIGRIANMVNAPFLQAFGLISQIAFRILVEVAVALLVLAIPDYLFQRRQHLESLKMSRQEVKEERKMFEGDPLVKSRLRERMRELLSRNMMQNVPEADVVVTNPTHYAVAMQWERDTMEAPTVTAKGHDRIAERIKEVAREANVPVVENKPFARALFAEVEIGDTIPEKYYEVMALILAEVYRLAGKPA